MQAVQLYTPKRSRVPLSVEKKKCIIQYKIDHPSSTQNDIRTHFIAKWGARIGRSTISEVLKDKDKWLQATARGNCLSLRGCREPQLENALYGWFCEERSRVGYVTSEMILSQAKILGERLGVENFSYSKGWMERFKKRFDIRLKKPLLALKGNEEPKKAKIDVSLAREELSTAVREYAYKDIFSMDETALYYRLKPHSMLMNTSDRTHEDHITIALCSNSTGSEKLKPVVITKDANPRCFSKGFDPRIYVDYNHNPKALMTPALFCTWIKDFDDSMVKERRKVLLLVNMNNCHRLPDGLQNVQVQFLTSLNKDQLQPNNCGITKSFKFHYRKSLARHFIDTSDPFINLRQALPMIRGAWNSVQPHIVMNSWCNTGIIVRDSPSMLWYFGMMTQMEESAGELEEDVAKLVPQTPYVRELVQKWLVVDDEVETYESFRLEMEVVEDVEKSLAIVTSNSSQTTEEKAPERVTPEQFQIAISTTVAFLEQNSFLPGVIDQLDSIRKVKDFMVSHLRERSSSALVSKNTTTTNS